MSSDGPAVENEVRRVLLERYHDIVGEVLAAADAASRHWSGPITTDRTQFVPQFRQQLAEQGVLQRLPKLLIEAAAAADLELMAEPVAAPPYLVVTSTGVILRATSHTGRLVITVRTFAVRRSNEAGYERVNTDAASAVEVEFVPD